MNSICRRKKKPFIVIIPFTFLKSAPFVSRCVSLDDKTVFPPMMHQLGAVNLSCFGCNNMFCKLWHVTEFCCQTYVGHTNLTLNNCKTYSQSFKKKKGSFKQASGACSSCRGQCCVAHTFSDRNQYFQGVLQTFLWTMQKKCKTTQHYRLVFNHCCSLH